MFTTREEIEKWLQKMKVNHYTINDDLTVDVDDNVLINDKSLESEYDGIPVQFGIVAGGFTCAGNRLTSLKGSPSKVGGHFNASYNSLFTLEGCPTEVGKDFICANNGLMHLIGCPEVVNGTLYANNNQLFSLKGIAKIVKKDLMLEHNFISSLEGFPEVGKSIHLHQNLLKSLKGIPKVIKGDLYCMRNRLTSLQDGPQTVKKVFNCMNNELLSLEYAPKAKDFYAAFNPIKVFDYKSLSIKGWFTCSHDSKQKLSELSQYYDDEKLKILFKDLLDYLEKKEFVDHLDKELIENSSQPNTKL